MNLVAGAVGSIITKLGELLHGEYKLQKGLPEQIEYLRNELETAHKALYKVGETPPEHLDPQVRLWAGDVREASYDMEDILDAFLVDVMEGAAPADNKSKKGLLKRLKKLAKLLKKSKARHDIASAIEDMKKRLQEVCDRHKRYSIPIAVAAPATKMDPRLVDMHKEAAQIIGIERTRAELIALLQSSSHVHGQAGVSSNSDKTKVVSVVGAGGLGKTTLAKAVYDVLSPGYDCRAFVSVGRNPDLVQVFTSIVFGLDQIMYQTIRGIKDLQVLIVELRKFLENKRFFIVIDDVWDRNSWQALGSALHQNNNGSRVVKTTRNLEVACGDEVYKLGILSYDNSKKLFYMRLYGGEDKCPAHHPEEASQKILDKCGGVPLAIITMASLLVGKSREHWFEVCNSPDFYRGRDSEQIDNTVWILSLSFYDLPSHLKTCLLYLSVYPEDYEIEKVSLIWKWVAEGFIEKETGTSLFQRGEEYFHQLINRSMIQGTESEEDGIIYGCRVHDMVLDLIRGLAGEENFITISNGDGGTSSRHKVRRIAHQNRILLDQSHPDSHRDMTQLRTLVAHGCDIRGWVLSPSLKLLRVLALERCTSSDNFEFDRHGLEHLGNLVHLRYLGLGGTMVKELPKAIGALKLLQTLDLEHIGGYGMELQLPSSVNVLTQLVCLRCGHWLRVPDGILQKVTSLEELQIDVSKLSFESMRQFLNELGYLSLLRVLHVNGMYSPDESIQEELLKSLDNLPELRHLDLYCFDIHESSAASIKWDKVVLPEHLRYLRIQGIWFPCVPTFINPTLLPNLCYLDMCLDHVDEAGLCCLNIRHSHENFLIPGFGQLRNLRILYGFRVHLDIDGDGAWCSLEEIRPRSHLRKLHLHGLENVPTSASAEMAMISIKEHLDYLQLQWSSSIFMGMRDEVNRQQQQRVVEEVIENLTPPCSIRHLQIEGYFGRRLPNWMMVPVTCAFKSLRILRIDELGCCNQLPNGLCQLPSLELLDISDAPAIKIVGPEFQSPSSSLLVGGDITTARSIVGFPNLAKLRLGGLCEWEEWDWEEQVKDCTVDAMAMPVLYGITISNCKLSCLPTGLASMKRFALRELRLYNLSNLKYVDNFPSVVELDVFNCPILRRISGLFRLQKINITCCPNVEVLEGVPLLDSMELQDTTMDTLPEYIAAVALRYLKLTCSKKLYESSLSGCSSENDKINHIKSYIIDYVAEDED